MDATTPNTKTCMIRGLTAITLRVRNLQRSRRFYRDVLGFESLQNDDSGTVHLSLPNAGLQLTLTGGLPNGAVMTGLGHLAFEVGTRGELLALRRLATCHRATVTAIREGSDQTSLIMFDPDGHKLELFAPQRPSLAFTTNTTTTGDA